MHSVIRLNKPESLTKNAETWTRDLTHQIRLDDNDYAKVENKYKIKYKQLDIANALVKMYSGSCCFCESTLRVQTYERIEHLKPKSKFPELSFEWDNLNLVCEICNTSYKKDKWDDNCPFLDPSSDKEDVADFLKLDLETGEYNPIDDNERAKYTIDNTGLNRKELVGIRLAIIDECINLSKKLEKETLIECIRSSIAFKASMNLLQYPTTYNSIIECLR